MIRLQEPDIEAARGRASGSIRIVTAIDALISAPKTTASIALEYLAVLISRDLVRWSH